jgi:peptide/nickel transport system substrate-binding protein
MISFCKNEVHRVIWRRPHAARTLERPADMRPGCTAYASARLWIFLLAFALLSVGKASTPHAQSEIRLAVTNLPPSQFNPYRNTGLPYVYTWSAVFDGLTAIDENGDVQPALAKSWENIDPLTWVFHLRDDVTFSNGRPFTADAAVFAVNFLRSEQAAREVVGRMMSFLAGARALDDHTIEITTSVPTPLLPRFFPQLYMVEPDHFAALGLEGFAADPIATGPFIVDDIGPARVMFRAFRDGWRAPIADSLEILGVPDNATRALSVNAGALDVALSLGPEEARTIRSAGGTSVSWRDAAIWAYNFIGGREPALDDIRVREALNLAVDRDAIIEALLDGATIPATQPAPPKVYGFNPDLPPIPYDPDRAKALLVEAGYADGFDIVVEGSAGSSANDSAVNLTVAQFLGQVGVRMEVQTVNVNQLIRNVVEGTWNGQAFALHYNHEPTSEVLRALDTHSCLWSKPWYCNQAVMPLITAAQTEFDPALNLKLRQDVMAFYRNDWAALFMYQAPRFAGLAPGVSGLTVVNNVVSYDTLSPASEAGPQD